MATIKKKVKKKKKMAPMTKLLCVVFLAASAFFTVSIISEVYTTFTLRSQLAEIQAQLEEVESDNEYLTEQKEKLQDPDYVESYARANYNLSKEGEQIFYLPEDDSE